MFTTTAAEIIGFLLTLQGDPNNVRNLRESTARKALFELKCQSLGRLIDSLSYPEDEMEFLYRGVSVELYGRLKGKLKPKQEKYAHAFQSFACAGNRHAGCGSGVIAGESVKNTVILHQWKRKGFPTSGISTTPFENRAKEYALTESNVSEGYIYKLSVKLLKDAGVSIYRVRDYVPWPYVPEDDEYVIVAKNFKGIPESAIVSIFKIQFNCCDLK